MLKKIINIILFGLTALIMGFCAGFLLWFVLNLLNFGIEFFWNTLPNKYLNIENYYLIYLLIVCLTGGLLIGLIQKKHGVYPDTTEEVIEIIKEKGYYPYDKLGLIAISTLLPLIFGGALGPEAGLVGFIAGLGYLVTDSMKVKGHKIKALDKEHNEALTETSVAVVLSVIFRSPLFAVANVLEPDRDKETYKKRFFEKKGRIYLYIMGLIGSILSVEILNKWLNFLGIAKEGGIPKFDADFKFFNSDWKWFVVMMLVGIVFAIIYLFADKYTKILADKIKDKVILRCLIAGLCVAICGFFLPYTMFSGEHQMTYLMDNWQSISITILILTAFFKLILVNICINFGWHGGSIFPIIFSGVSLGYALALLLGTNGVFTIAIVLASMYGYIARRPGTVIAIMLLCFPINAILPIMISAIIATKIPNKFLKLEEAK